MNNWLNYIHRYYLHAKYIDDNIIKQNITLIDPTKKQGDSILIQLLLINNV